MISTVQSGYYRDETARPDPERKSEGGPRRPAYIVSCAQRGLPGLNFAPALWERGHPRRPRPDRASERASEAGSCDFFQTHTHTDSNLWQLKDSTRKWSRFFQIIKVKQTEIPNAFKFTRKSSQATSAKITGKSAGKQQAAHWTFILLPHPPPLSSLTPLVQGGQL